MNGTTAVLPKDNFSAGYYWQTISTLIRKPTGFFQAIPAEIGFRKPFLFLLVSGLIHAALSLTQITEQRGLLAVIFFLNAVGMPVITAGLTFPLISMFTKTQGTFPRYFAIYAFSFGTFLLVSWMPSFLWFAETTKWIFVGIGMYRTLELKKWQALIMVLLSIGLTMGFFWLFNYLLIAAKGI
jgi:hypothetical protein